MFLIVGLWPNPLSREIELQGCFAMATEAHRSSKAGCFSSLACGQTMSLFGLPNMSFSLLHIQSNQQRAALPPHHQPRLLAAASPAAPAAAAPPAPSPSRSFGDVAATALHSQFSVPEPSLSRRCGTAPSLRVSTYGGGRPIRLLIQMSSYYFFS